MTRAIRDDLTAILHYLHEREDFHRDLCDSCGYEVGTTLSGLRARLERLYRATGRECTCPPSAYDPRSHLIGCPVVSVQAEPPARPSCDCDAPRGALPEDIVGHGALYQAGWEAGCAWERARREAEPLPVCAGDGRGISVVPHERRAVASGTVDLVVAPPCDCGMTKNQAMTCHTAWCAYARWDARRAACDCARPGEARERHADHCPVRRGA